MRIPRRAHHAPAARTRSATDGERTCQKVQSSTLGGARAVVGGGTSVRIVGVDELDSGGERVSWRSPLATALLKARVGDGVTLRTPRGSERPEVTAIRYDALS